ncbi:MAG: protein O-mannosyl-transferase family [Bacteroidales bacterium]
MKRLKQLNILVGWLVFLVAAVVYLLTIESTASFWDCSERIVAAYKLEVPHPPGAPFFMLLGNLFTIFAFGNVEVVAVMMNAMSALASAFTILFLFWSITHLSRRLIIKNTDEPSFGQIIAIIGSGAVGALAYTFTDSFWFVAVEAEAYATSSLFTALVFWAILKWENEAHKPHANRWLVLIAYVMGLSIGVHLLNLLTIPAIVFVFYFKKYKITRWGIVGALATSVALLGSIMYVIIPGIVTLASKFELLFVNAIKLPYNSGVIIFIVTLALLLAYSLWYTTVRKRVLLHTLILGVTVITIGYSSYAMLVIRAQANPPMNQNNPKTVFALLHYLNREQYGERPLVTGQYYNAPVVNSKDKQTYIRKNGRYEKTYLKTQYEFDKKFTTVFPRMWSWRDDHIGEYKKWGKIEGRPVRTTGSQGEQQTKQVPTFGENLRFFFNYQIGHMYWRYFMWNFVGRQNDVQGHGELLNGNWITGIKPLDSIRLGNQDNLTTEMLNHPARNTYYMLPLVLGLIGLVYQFMRDKNNFWVVTLLFVLTGLAIVVYLNQTPLQPRERDYSYVGSFYAFSIWIGLGVLALYEFIRRHTKQLTAASLAILLALSVPTILATENWNDHDRSGRYVARDFAHNYLNTCEPNAIIFTNGDNDTFPLWYAQEVEGIRTDVRVVNLSLLGTDWYTEQMKWKTYESEPLPITMDFDKYVQGTRDVIYVMDRIDKPVELNQVMDFIASDEPGKRWRAPNGEMIDYMPTRKLKLKVDKEKVLENGIVRPEDENHIVDHIEWTINKDAIQKNEMMVLEILANNNWERPVYFVSTGGDSDVGLSDYLQLDGFAYKLVPIKTEPEDYLSVGRVNVDTLYNNYMENFKWGGIDEPNVFVDHNVQRTTMVLRLRNNFNRLAEKLIEQEKRDSAVKVLDRIVELLPQDKFPYNFFVLGIIESYYKVNETEKANDLFAAYAKSTNENLDYYFSLGRRYRSSVMHEAELNLQIFQELIGIGEEYGQDEITKEFEDHLSRHMSSFYQMER